MLNSEDRSKRLLAKIASSEEAQDNPVNDQKRIARLKRIRTKIDSGAYKINTEEIAKSLFVSH